MRITNMLGQDVQFECLGPVEGSEKSFNIIGHPPGIYYLILTWEEGQAYNKLIIE